jgi:hypothetical protein
MDNNVNFINILDESCMSGLIEKIRKFSDYGETNQT